MQGLSAIERGERDRKRTRGRERRIEREIERERELAAVPRNAAGPFQSTSSSAFFYIAPLEIENDVCVLTIAHVSWRGLGMRIFTLNRENVTEVPRSLENAHPLGSP